MCIFVFLCIIRWESVKLSCLCCRHWGETSSGLSVLLNTLYLVCLIWSGPGTKLFWPSIQSAGKMSPTLKKTQTIGLFFKPKRGDVLLTGPRTLQHSDPVVPEWFTPSLALQMYFSEQTPGELRVELSDRFFRPRQQTLLSHGEDDVENDSQLGRSSRGA